MAKQANNNFKKKVKPVSQRVEIEFRDFNDDFTEEVTNKKRVIIVAEHSKSYAKEYAFKLYANKKYNYKGNKYIVAVAHLDSIPVTEMKPVQIVEKLKTDLDRLTAEFKTRYPSALLEKGYGFHYALDYSEKSGIAEIITMGVLRVTDTYIRTQVSPIVTLTAKQYKDILTEGTLLNDIITEKRMGIEQYGLVGLITDGKFKTHNMYMECLCDIIPEYKDDVGFRPKLLQYKNYRTSKSAYMYSIKTEEEKKEYVKLSDSEDDMII